MIRRTLKRTLTGMAMTLCSLVVAQAQAPDVAALASHLSPLPRAEGKVSIPLDIKSPWRSINAAGKVTVSEGRLVVSYVIAPGQPAGAALLFGKGSLSDLRVLHIRATAEKGMQLLPTLQSADGVAFSFPAFALVKGKTVDVELRADELSYFAPQSKVGEPDHFSPGDAVILTLLDVSGFTGGSGAASFTIESIEGELR